MSDNIKQLHTIDKFKAEGWETRLLHWSMFMVYKPFGDESKSGFEALVFKFNQCDYKGVPWEVLTEGSLFIKCTAYYDGIKHLDFYDDEGCPTVTLSGDMASEMLLPAIEELKDLEGVYCMDMNDVEGCI